MANPTALRKVVPANKVAFDAISDVDQLVAFLNGAVAMIHASGRHETERDAVETIYLIEAAVERAGKLRQALDCGLVESLAA